MTTNSPSHLTDYLERKKIANSNFKSGMIVGGLLTFGIIYIIIGVFK